MWFTISLILHGVLLLGGLFHWRGSETIAVEVPMSKVTMNFSIKSESLTEKISIEQPKVVQPKIEKKELVKPKEEAKKIEESKEKVKIKEIVEPISKVEEREVENSENISGAKASENPIVGGEINNLDASGVTEVSEGVYIAQSQGVEGIEYKILFEQNPEYPIMAKRIGYKKPVEINVKFLVGYDGKVEEINFDGADVGMGFRSEVEKVLKRWRFSPVTLKDREIKMYFYKTFVFNQIS